MIDRDPFQPGPHQAQHRYTPSDRERDDRHLDHGGQPFPVDRSKVPCTMPTVTLGIARGIRDLIGRDETILQPAHRAALIQAMNVRIAAAEEFAP